MGASFEDDSAFSTDGAGAVSTVSLDLSDYLVALGTTVLYGETSVGDPGFEQGSVNYAGSTFDAILKVNDFGGGRDAVAIFHRHSTVDACNVLFTRSLSNTSAHAALTDGDDVARLIFAAHDGTDYNPIAEVRAAVDGTLATDDTPGRLELWTTPSGTNAPVLRATVDNSGTTTLAAPLVFPSYSDATRGAAGTAGRVIFNTTDGNLNIDNGVSWILPDGTTT